MVLQEYQNLGLILSAAFGGGKDNKPEPPKTFAEAKSQFLKVMGK